MALGSWLGGASFDVFGSYPPAFKVGVAFNLVNIAIVSFLILRTQPASCGGLFQGGATGWKTQVDESPGPT